MRITIAHRIDGRAGAAHHSPLGGGILLQKRDLVFPKKVLQMKNNDYTFYMSTY